jgi:hypothetical protein
LDTQIAIRAGGDTAQAEAVAPRDTPPLLPIVPWEEFDNDKNHVLVLWLDEDFLTAGRQPISSLVELRSHLGLPLSSKFVLLGPEDSTMLEAMVREAPKVTDARFSIYNFGATAAEAKILQNLRQSGSIQKLFEQSKIGW